MKVKGRVEMHEIILLIKNVFWRTGLGQASNMGPGDKQRTKQIPHSHRTYSILKRQTKANEQTNTLKLIFEKCHENRKPGERIRVLGCCFREFVNKGFSEEVTLE